MKNMNSPAWREGMLEEGSYGNRQTSPVGKAQEAGEAQRHVVRRCGAAAGQASLGGDLWGSETCVSKDPSSPPRPNARRAQGYRTNGHWEAPAWPGSSVEGDLG